MVKLIGFIMACVVFGFLISTTLQSFVLAVQTETLNNPVLSHSSK